MAEIIVMPALGNSVESCIINTWLVQVGDTIAQGQTLCEVETDKATMEVPSTGGGTVLAILWGEGDEVPVKEPLLVVGAPGEDPALALAAAGVSAPREAQAAPEEAIEQSSPQTQRQPTRVVSNGASSPRARSLAENKRIDIAQIATGSGPNGRVIVRDVIQAAAGLTASAGAGVGVEVAGTGLGGRVTAEDLTGVGSQVAQPASAQSAVTTVTNEVVETPIKGIRKVISERMMASLAGSAQLTYTTTACAAGLLEMRKLLKSSDPELGLNRVTVGDLVGYAAVKTALRHPSHNSHVVDGMLRTFSAVHLGFACDTPRGLLVPVIHDASAMTLRKFSATSKELAEAAIDGTIQPDLLNGASFTVTNLGGFGIESFTPILNAPQTAILGVDAIFPRAVIGDDGQVGVEQRIGFSLTADHRVIDGADAARFLQDLVRAIENIQLTVLS